MAEIEISAKTAEAAIAKGLKELKCKREDVEIKILNEGDSGLFGLGGKKESKVRITTKTDIKKTEYDVDYALVQKRVKEILTDLFGFMNITYKQIDTALITGRVLVDIKSDESSLIIGKSGQTLDALETIVNLILNRNEKTRTKVSIDTGKFRKKQEEKLITMAQNAADEVRKTGQPYHFGPMPAKDRKIIHLFLQNDNEVETVSEGEGVLRTLSIKPKK
ncbi:RNA-binding cell elongation regulator Jag/EloR [Elusimicrobiota bacterium]